MTAPTAPHGRGAWSKVGKDNGSNIYEYISGKPLDGSTPDKSLAYGAVNLGVLAIQQRINKEGYAPALVEDGILGAKTGAGIKWFQTKSGLKADGRAGAVTNRVMWHKPIADATTSAGIDPQWIYGLMVQESSGDPGACGYVNEPDRGLIQINTAVQTDVSIQQAHDPYFAMVWASQRFKEANAKYTGKGALVQINASILQHNTPAGADSYFKTGKYVSQVNADYVTNIRQYAEGWS